jgi:hypothetical protein
MTNEERDLIAKFIERVAGGSPQPQSGFAGSVPATAAPLPPIDREADAHLADLFQRFPEARYRISQLAYVQEQALNQAANRISSLEAELSRARQAQQEQTSQPSPWGTPMAQSAPPQAQQPRGFFSSLFGGGQQQQPQYAPPPQAYPQPQYQQPQYQQPQYQQPQYQQPQYQQPGMLGRSGSGFFGSALTTAAGVAGGMVAGNALMNLFEGHHGYEGGYGGFGSQAAFTPPVEYVPVPTPDAQPWGAPPVGTGTDPYDMGGAQKADPGFVDNSGWTDTSNTDPGWTDTSASDGGSDWTDTSNGD